MTKFTGKITRSVTIAKSDIIPNDWNPNRTSDKQQKAIAESLDYFGQLTALLVRPHPEISGKYQIVDGEHRYGELEDTIVVDIIEGASDRDIKKLTVIMNETRGDADKIELAKLLADLQEQSDSLEELSIGLPYDETDLQELIDLASIDWESQFNDEPPVDDEPSGSGAAAGGGWEKIEALVDQEGVDTLQQCRDLISQEIDLNQKKDLAWGQVIVALAQSYLGGI